jgi:hypothetical protein
MRSKHDSERLEPSDIGKSVDGLDWLEDENGRRLPLSARHLLVILISRAKKSRPPYIGYPTESYLAQKLNISTRQVRKLKEMLKRLDLINWYQTDRKSACRYMINWKYLVKLGEYDGGIIQADAERRKKNSNERLRKTVNEGNVTWGYDGTYLDIENQI